VRFTCIIRGITEVQRERGTWPELRLRLAAAFLAETQSHWTEVFADLDACVSPVLTLDEAYREPQLAEAGTYVEAFGMRQPAHCSAALPNSKARCAPGRRGSASIVWRCCSKPAYRRARVSSFVPASCAAPKPYWRAL
jgi:crotonobetainyl-CoA:carnitine CoA-transferase CaiB-like acyl-CoA transferase